MFSKNIFSQTTSEIFNVEKNNRFSLNIFYGRKKVYDIIKSDEQRCIKFVTVSNQSDLIILFAEFLSEVFVIIFIWFHYIFCFFLNKLQKIFLKENVFLMHLCLLLKVFFETVMQSLCPGSIKEIFSTYERSKDYSCDFLRIINNHYIDYCNKRSGK